LGVEFSLEVIERDGINLFELSAENVNVHFNKLSVDLIGEKSSFDVRNQCGEGDQDYQVVGVCEVDVTAKGKRIYAGGSEFVETGDKQNLYSVHGLEASRYDVGQTLNNISAAEVGGHNFSAAKLLVEAWLAEQMVAKQERGCASIQEHLEESQKIKEIAKTATQPSKNPPILLFK
jgi:hypothetical protein